MIHTSWINYPFLITVSVTHSTCSTPVASSTSNLNKPVPSICALTVRPALITRLNVTNLSVPTIVEEEELDEEDEEEEYFVDAHQNENNETKCMMKNALKIHATPVVAVTECVSHENDRHSPPEFGEEDYPLLRRDYFVGWAVALIFVIYFFFFWWVFISWVHPVTSHWIIREHIYFLVDVSTIRLMVHRIMFVFAEIFFIWNVKWWLLGNCGTANRYTFRKLEV